MYKLGYLKDGTWLAHHHAAVFQLPETGSGAQRLVAGVPDGDPQVFGALVSLLAPPYHLLYVLHTPRGEADAGRYQSPTVDRNELAVFLSDFGQFLACDARFDLWAYSPQEQATVVWDRHNRIFAYGPIARFERALLDMDFAPGSSEIGFAHEHHYHAELDGQAAQLLRAFDWQFSVLHEEDAQ
jgi:hypothetical protein